MENTDLAETKEQVDDHGMGDLNFSKIAQEQNVTRSAVARRAARGWSREEILLGKRFPFDHPSDRVYNSSYSGKLGGFTVQEVAAHNKISEQGMYYRLQNNREFEIPPRDDEEQE